VLNAVAHRLDDAARRPGAGIAARWCASQGWPLFSSRDAGSRPSAGAPLHNREAGCSSGRPAQRTALSWRVIVPRACRSSVKPTPPEFGLSFTTSRWRKGTDAQSLGPRRAAPGVPAVAQRPPVAAGVVPFAHASDGAGSIRLPASHCGNCSVFKPSRMRNPCWDRSWASRFTACRQAHGRLSRSVRDKLPPSSMLLPAAPSPAIPTAAAPSAAPLISVRRSGTRGPLRIGFSRSITDRLAGRLPPAPTPTRRARVTFCESLGHVVEEAMLEYDGRTPRAQCLAGDRRRQYRTLCKHPATLRVAGRAMSGLIEPVKRCLGSPGRALRARSTSHRRSTKFRRAGRCVGPQLRAPRWYYSKQTLARPARPPLLGVARVALTTMSMRLLRSLSGVTGPFTAIYNATGCPAHEAYRWAHLRKGCRSEAHFGPRPLGRDGRAVRTWRPQIERASPPGPSRQPFARGLRLGHADRCTAPQPVAHKRLRGSPEDGHRDRDGRSVQTGARALSGGARADRCRASPRAGYGPTMRAPFPASLRRRWGRTACRSNLPERIRSGPLVQVGRTPPGRQ